MSLIDEALIDEALYGELSAPCQCVYPEVCFCENPREEGSKDMTDKRERVVKESKDILVKLDSALRQMYNDEVLRDDMNEHYADGISESMKSISAAYDSLASAHNALLNSKTVEVPKTFRFRYNGVMREGYVSRVVGSNMLGIMENWNERDGWHSEPTYKNFTASLISY